jgi:hypothetical protein
MQQQITTPQSAPGGWPTTRCYPRTTDDAFKGADYGCAIEAYSPEASIIGRVGRWLLVGACFLVAAAWGL